jgi:hypothetical protein
LRQLSFNGVSTDLCAFQRLLSTFIKGLKTMKTKFSSTVRLSTVLSVLLSAGCGGGGSSSSNSANAATSAAQESGVASAKQLFASLRTNLNAIADSRTVLEARAELVKSDFKKAIAPLDGELANWVAVPIFAIDYLARYKAGSVSTATVSLSGRGECTVVSDDLFTVPASTAGNARNIVCLINKTVANDQTTHSLVSQLMEIKPGSTPSAYTYSAHTRLNTTVNGSPVSSEVVGNYGNSTNRATGTIQYTLGNTGANFGIQGQLPARTDDAGHKVTDYEVWNLNAVIGQDGATAYNLTSTMTSWLDNEERGTISINPGSRLRMNAVPGAFSSKLIQEFSLSITGRSGTSAITGSLSLADWGSDKTGALYAPARTVFNGSLTQGGQPFFSGELRYTNAGLEQFDSTVPITDSNFLTQTAGLSGELAIPLRPLLKVSLAVTTGRAGARDLTAQYDDGTSVISLVGKHAGGTDSPPDSATVSSNSGVSVLFNEADLDAKRTVDVKKDGATVATLNFQTGVINYADGTFESVK